MCAKEKYHRIVAKLMSDAFRDANFESATRANEIRECPELHALKALKKDVDALKWTTEDVDKYGHWTDCDETRLCKLEARVFRLTCHVQKMYDFAVTTARSDREGCDNERSE